MPVEFSDHHHQIAGNLKFLFEALGIRELFERVNELDSLGATPEEPEFNPTNDPMVQPNLEGVGSLSGGPNSENTGTLDVLEPERMARIKEEAEAAEKAAAEEKKTTSSRSTSSSTAKSK
jgi:hypothetical protein